MSIVTKPNYNKPWVEKYRPTTLDDIVHHNEVVSVLKQTLITNDFPNLLLYGPPGTGKTSAIIALSRSMFGPRFEGLVLQLNASDERGIVVIRERVRRFAQSIPIGSQGDLNGLKQGRPNLKLVILDEADSMTSAAQACLRRTMEIHSKSTRFCLICNYVSRIIEPIASRCSKFRFQPIAPSLMLQRLDHICINENIRYSDHKVLEHLISFCDGDLRQAITTLQSAHRLAGQDNHLDMDSIHEVSGFVPRRYINRFVAICKQKSIESLESYILDLIHEGFTAAQFLNHLHEWTLSQSNISNSGLAKILSAFALAEHRFCDGSDEHIQLLYVTSIIMKNFDAGISSQ